MFEVEIDHRCYRAAVKMNPEKHYAGVEPTTSTIPVQCCTELKNQLGARVSL